MSSGRISAIIIVAVLHALLGYAFITGLAYNVIKKAAEDLKTFDVVEEPPPPEEEPPPPPPDVQVQPPPVVSPPPIVRRTSPIESPSSGLTPLRPVITSRSPTMSNSPPQSRRMRCRSCRARDRSERPATSPRSPI